VFEFNSVGFLRPAWADARVLAGTGSRAMMFKHKWVSASESRHEPGGGAPRAGTSSCKHGRRRKPAPFPGFVEPCHPTLREQAPPGVRWARLLRSWEKTAMTRRLGSNWRISPQSGSGRKRGIDGEET
jgi:hypothetical protein